MLLVGLASMADRGGRSRSTPPTRWPGLPVMPRPQPCSHAQPLVDGDYLPVRAAGSAISPRLVPHPTTSRQPCVRAGSDSTVDHVTGVVSAPAPRGLGPTGMC